MNKILFFCLLITVTVFWARADVEIKFQNFEQVHSRIYASSGERLKRAKIFEENLKNIENSNLQAATENLNLVFGPNQFTDLTDEEFAKLYTGFDPSKMQEDLEEISAALASSNTTTKSTKKTSTTTKKTTTKNKLTTTKKTTKKTSTTTKKTTQKPTTTVKTTKGPNRTNVFGKINLLISINNNLS